jgi:hypothetical protein
MKSGGLTRLLKKSVLLKGTASAVPKVLCDAALAAEVRFFPEALFQHLPTELDEPWDE